MSTNLKNIKSKFSQKVGIKNRTNVKIFERKNILLVGDIILPMKIAQIITGQFGIFPESTTLSVQWLVDLSHWQKWVAIS